MIMMTDHQSQISLCWLKMVPLGQRKEDLLMMMMMRKKNLLSILRRIKIMILNIS